MDSYKLFIDGKFVDAKDGKVFETIDPGNELPIATVAQAGKADAEAAIQAARRAFEKGDWSNLSPAARAEFIYKFADQIVQQSFRLAVTESMDAGQVIDFCKTTAGIQAGQMRNLAHLAATKFPWIEEIPDSGNPFCPGLDYLRREPIGVCVGIIPWNFPMMMAFWKITQAIIMGNTVVLKPASVTPLSALIIAEAVKAAGIPKGVVNVITGPGAELGKVLCMHPDVDKISFTGSTEVGREIMKMASDTVKKVTLELGGKSANIILDDTDMDMAVEGAVLGTFFHQGQVCESGTRLLVQSKIYDEFVSKLKKRTEALRVGYQLLTSTHIGPLVSATQLATVDNYVKIGKKEGAEILTGGKRVEVEGIKGGFYYAPTVFINANNKMRIAQEEIFGPVVTVLKFNSDEEAVAIANDSIYGLGGSVFSGNNERAERIAQQVRTGTMWINSYHAFGDFCPFGGYKQSGFGKELGQAGLEAFTNIKRMHIAGWVDPDSNHYMNILSDRNKVNNFQFWVPTKVIAGHGMLSNIIKEVADFGCKRAMIMTDPGVVKAGLVKLVQNALASFYVGVFDQIPQDTNPETIDAAADKARSLNADCIVSVGGGSVIDTSKALSVVLKNGGRANDHIGGWNRLKEPQTPHIVIPTTSGTGSEVTSAAVIKCMGADRKLYILDPRIMPEVAILDPRFTMTLPPALTASTAMDAMTHAVEAMCTTTTNEISNGLALHAIRMIKENLPLAVADGKNEKARLNMQIAATMAGWAFAIANVGLAHSMAHTVGAQFGVPHGAACGIMLPKVMRFNADASADNLALVAQALGVNTFNMDKRQAALAAADAIEALMKSVGHPMTLREFNVPEESLEMCAAHAASDVATLFNACQVNDPSEVLALYKQVY